MPSTAASAEPDRVETVYGPEREHDLDGYEQDDETPRGPGLVRRLLPWAFIALALLGLVIWVYAFWLRHELESEQLAMPEHQEWMAWGGPILLLLGGLPAFALLLWRYLRRPRTA